MSEELNLGSDWEQSKDLVKMWHHKWARANSEIERYKKGHEILNMSLHQSDERYIQLMDQYQAMKITKELWIIKEHEIDRFKEIAEKACGLLGMTIKSFEQKIMKKGPSEPSSD